MKISTDIKGKWLKLFNRIDDLNQIIDNLPEDFRIVYTYGAWDLLHPGHIRFLSRARELGDFLIVGVVSDTPIQDLKGEERPIQTLSERLIIVSSLRIVDATIIQPEYDPSDQLQSLKRVSILTKGDDWEYIPGEETITKLGGKLVKLSYTEGVSTSYLVSKLSKSLGE